MVTAVEQVSSPSVYKYLSEAEVFLPGMGITPDENLFARRDRLYMAHTTQPWTRLLLLPWRRSPSHR